MKSVTSDDTNSLKIASQTAYPVLFAISGAHMINDTLQAIIPAIYPLLKDTYELTYFQIGMITFVFQVSASLLQPLVGNYTDRNPKPYALAVGMLLTMLGLLILGAIDTFVGVLICVAIIGTGSAIFHPEASRLAFLASGGKRGMAQSLFQVGGNAGSAIGPLIAALVIVQFGLHSVGWFAILALAGALLLFRLGVWYKENRVIRSAAAKKSVSAVPVAPHFVTRAMIILVVLLFSKYVYTVSIGSYYTFYLIEKFGVSIQESQLYLFYFMAAVAVGTFAGGPIGDRIGRRKVIWFSILGAAPFALALPYASLWLTNILAICVGLVISSAFSAILVYAQELRPGKEGAIAGLFFGIAFGIAGIGSAVLGVLIDYYSLTNIFIVCSFLPLLGILAAFLPTIKRSSAE